MTSRPAWFRRLSVKVTLYGVCLLLVSTAAVIGVGKVYLGSVFEADRMAVAQWVSRHAKTAHDPTAIQRDMEDIGLALRMGATLYDLEGKVLGSTITPPLPPPSDREVAALGDGKMHRIEGHYSDALGLSEGSRRIGYVVVGYSVRRLTTMPVVILGAILFVLALASLYFARSLTAPLRSLSGAAQAFGAGNLETRARSRRGDEIGDLARSFDTMADRIVGLLRAQKELLAGVSHELRTPLARLRVAVELIQDGDADQAKVCLPELGQDLAELERLVDDILITTRLDFAAQDGGRLPALHRASISASDMVRSSAARFRSLYPGRALEVEAADALPTVVVDASLLRRAVDNLLDNAQKYSPRPTAVRLLAKQDANVLVIEVVDHGAGIPKDDLVHLFTPFFRGDRSRTRNTGGTGLGLALAQRIVHAHGGTLEIESSPGQGTTARMRVPASPVDAARPEPCEPRNEATGR